MSGRRVHRGDFAEPDPAFLPSVQRLLDVTGLRRHFHVVAPHNL